LEVFYKVSIKNLFKKVRIFLLNLQVKPAGKTSVANPGCNAFTGEQKERATSI
jgi:hypothetical protein